MEECNGLDDDCSGVVDDHLTVPAQECVVGVGACERSGLKYKTCLGADGWSNTYSACDAVAGDPVDEICNNNIDDDCNGGETTNRDILDNFDRDDGILGQNSLDNLWTNAGELWSIQNNEAYISWNSSGTHPVASSEIGYQETFDITLKFRLDSSGQGGAGVFLFAVNADRAAYVDGFVANIGMNDLETHGVRRGTTTIEQATRPISNRVDYLMRFAYDGSNLKLKLWENDAPEPVDFLINTPTTNVDPSKTYMSLLSDLDSGESASVFVDYITKNCGP